MNKGQSFISIVFAEDDGILTYSSARGSAQVIINIGRKKNSAVPSNHINNFFNQT